MDAPAVVTTDWLRRHGQDPGVLVVETGKNPEAYARGHIPGAVLAPCHPYLKRHDARGERTQHVMPAAEFAGVCRELGLQRGTHVVVYDDRHGLYGARFRAVCRHFGCERVSVLDGGWHAWVADGGAVETTVRTPSPGTDLVPAPVAGRLVTAADLRAALADGAVRVWDTRTDEEFAGLDARENARRGHVPGAHHLPWTDLLDNGDEPGAVCRLRPRDEVAARLAAAGLGPGGPVVTYCQSGIRAAFAQWILEWLDYPDARLYDASMGEWANTPDTPLVLPGA